LRRSHGIWAETERAAGRMVKRRHAAGIGMAHIPGDGNVWIVE